MRKRNALLWGLKMALLIVWGITSTAIIAAAASHPSHSGMLITFTVMSGVALFLAGEIYRELKDGLD